MWVWIIIAVAVVALAAWALWPRRGGISDGQVLSSRRSTHGGLESKHSTNQRNWPTGS